MEIAKEMDGEELTQFAKMVKSIAEHRGIEASQIYDELAEIATVNGIRSEVPPPLDKPYDKKMWVRQQLAEIGRGRSYTQAARFLRWAYFCAPTRMPVFLQKRLGVSVAGDMVAAATTGSGVYTAPDRLDLSSNGLDRLKALAVGHDWAQLVEVTKRFEMLGIGRRTVPKFALGAYLQIRIQPPIDGFISLFNVDHEARGSDKVILLDPIISNTDLITYAGTELMLPSATAGLPVGGLEGIRSTLIICISSVSVSDLWNSRLYPGQVFEPDDAQLRRFTRLVLATDLRTRAVCAIEYQT